jgi:hypothetical protein
LRYSSYLRQGLECWAAAQLSLWSVIGGILIWETLSLSPTQNPISASLPKLDRNPLIEIARELDFVERYEFVIGVGLIDGAGPEDD